MGVAPGEPAIASIRRATGPRHAALETLLHLAAPLSARRYLDALYGFDLFLSAWEPRIGAALPHERRGWFAARSRHGLLRADLARLGGAESADRARAESACRQAVATIDLQGAAATYGSMYVLEGSALGGRVIARVACAALGFGPANGAAYFNGQDAGTAARWAEFCTLLEAQVGPDPQAREQACEAARQTFDALIRTFTCLGHEHAGA